MMLAQRTAKSLGLKDRLDPARSICGGLHYLKRMLEHLPDNIRAVERLRLALAAYNIGMGHLEDTPIPARDLGRDPNSWDDVECTLPMLSQHRHFKRLKYGYARSSDAVRYVQRIRNHHAVLERSLAATGGG